MTLVRRAARLPNVVRSVEALSGLGLAEEELRAHEQEFAGVAPAVYAQLEETATRAGDDLPAWLVPRPPRFELVPGNPAFWLFTGLHRVPFRHIGTMGVTRKP